MVVFVLMMVYVLCGNLTAEAMNVTFPEYVSLMTQLSANMALANA